MKTLTRKRIPPTRYPRTAEVDYRRALIRVYTAWFNTIIRALKESPEFIGLKEVRQDSNFNDIFDRARDRWGEESQKLASDLHRMTENVNRTSYISITGQKKAAGKSMGIDLGVGAIPFDPDIQGEIDASLRENVRLIKNLGTQSLDKIETMVTDTVRQGKLTKDLQKQLMDEYGATKRRAALIATDQVGKLNGNINRLRQKKAGVKQYTWNSMQDNRVRPEHAKRNGQVFSWDSPPPDGHPGQSIRCRCTPTPIFNDAEDFGLTPEEIAEDLAEQGLIEARQKAAVEARIKASSERKAEQTRDNRAKGAKKAAKTRAKNKLAEKAKSLGPGSQFGSPNIQPVKPDRQVKYDAINLHRQMVVHHNYQQMQLPESERTELLFAWGSNGAVIDVASGKRNGEDIVAVYFNVDSNKLNGAFVSHNHPISGGSLSGRDIQTAIELNLSSIEAIGYHNGKWFAYRIERPVNGWPDLGSNDLQKVVDVRGSALAKENFQSLVSENYSKVDRENWVRHQVIIELSDLYKLRYTVEELIEVPNAYRNFAGQ